MQNHFILFLNVNDAFALMMFHLISRVNNLFSCQYNPVVPKVTWNDEMLIIHFNLIPPFLSSLREREMGEREIKMGRA